MSLSLLEPGIELKQPYIQQISLLVNDLCQLCFEHAPSKKPNPPGVYYRDCGKQVLITVDTVGAQCRQREHMERMAKYLRASGIQGVSVENVDGCVIGLQTACELRVNAPADQELLGKLSAAYTAALGELAPQRIFAALRAISEELTLHLGPERGLQAFNDALKHAGLAALAVPTAET